jgi:hypothetical protein
MSHDINAELAAALKARDQLVIEYNQTKNGFDTWKISELKTAIAKAQLRVDTLRQKEVAAQPSLRGDSIFFSSDH